jgi:hypothetical protein
MSIASQLSFLVNLDGSLAVTATNISISSTTGAIVIAGGLGVSGATNIGGAMNVGGSLSIAGSVNISGTAAAGGYTIITTATVSSYGSASDSLLPKLSSIQISDFSYTPRGATSVSTSTGGYLIIYGSGFVSTPQVIVGTKLASAITFVNSSTLQVQVTAQSSGTYAVYIVNPDGGVAANLIGLIFN